MIKNFVDICIYKSSYYEIDSIVYNIYLLNMSFINRTF